MEKQKQLIVLGVLAVAGLGGAAAFFLTRGHGEADQAQQAIAAPPAGLRPGPGVGKTAPGKPGQKPGKKPGAVAARKPGTPGAPITGRDPFGGPAQAQSTGGMPGGAGGPVQVAALPKIKGPRTILHRKDPFRIDWTVAPLPPYVFQDVEPIRLADPNVEAPPTQPVEVRELPSRRVSGIMTGQGVYAILESGGEPEIVKPGSQTSDGYRVVSINDNSVKLQKRVQNYIYTQVVPLSDAPIGPARGGGFNPAGFQGPGPYGFPPAGGVPGGRGG